MVPGGGGAFGRQLAKEGVLEIATGRSVHSSQLEGGGVVGLGAQGNQGREVVDPKMHVG